MLKFQTQSAPNPWFVLIVVGLGTGLSLLGDSAMYTVLPTHTADAAITLTAVGVMLSANRWIRLFTNGPAGWLSDRFSRRAVFVPALFLGGISTLLYGLTTGYWPLLIARILWGISWSGIWIAGNAIVLDVSNPENRGKLVGFYNVAFFSGAALGAFLGGWLTDLWGYASAMRFEGTLTLVGAVIALLLLPETKMLRTTILSDGEKSESEEKETPPAVMPGEFGSILALIGFNRFLIAGMLTPTFALLLQHVFQDSVTIFGRSFGVTTLTGLSISLSALLGILILPMIGNLSDRSRNRWIITSFGLIPGIIGYLMLAIAWPWMIFVGLSLIQVTSSSNQGMATAMTGDISRVKSGSNLGILFTMGDLASAIAPLIVFWLIDSVGLTVIYAVAASMFGIMLCIAAWWSFRKPDRLNLKVKAA